MIDLKFLRENPEVVKQNIRNKFQDHKLPLVDEVIELDAQARAVQQEADELRASRNKLSKQIGQLMGQGKKDEAEEVKAQVNANAARLAELEEQEKELQDKVTKIMMTFQTSSIHLYRSEKMTAAMLRSKNSVSRLFLILRSHIIQTLWSVSMVSTLMQQEKLQETVSTI